ncbi:reverse transcriptase domain-containing protein [Citrobacter freundii]|jgi:hypothetical protein|uniref:reverse transcriptase domain-containing protein n=1 Tax=Citrobacter freundii TaxID=546 RepID=UPI003AADAD7E
MEESTNYRLIIWGLAIIQPASPFEVMLYLKAVLNDHGLLPDTNKMEEHFVKLSHAGYIENVSKRNNLYSITPQGNERLPPNLKKLRDKIRIFLLDKCHTESKLVTLASTTTENMGGASPSLQLRHTLKEVPHPSLPWASGTLPSRPRQAWVRIYEQLNIGSMFVEEASNLTNDLSCDDTKKVSTPLNSIKPLFSLNFYSFNLLDHDFFNSNGVIIVASCIGISQGLITAMMKSPERYYRSFDLIKKNGKKRPILAPRKFMKVTQYWINDHLLNRLKIHSSCYSYRKGVGIKENASSHLRRKFVANIDIVDYFGTINKTMIKNCFHKNKIPQNIINVISSLVTYHGSLPQGAPTSPAISNAILHDFDEYMSNAASLRDCAYTRYSDDITISGDIRQNVLSLIQLAEEELSSSGFSLNNEKKRIASLNSRQVVTGILVNNDIRPTRTYRKKIRSAFDHAFKEMDSSKETINKLKGYLNYLGSFKKYGYCFDEKKYREVITYLINNRNIT